MSHLNYFEPFKSKKPWHEDQLTRAFLVVLRYSPLTLFLFYNLIEKSLSEISKKKNIAASLPSMSEIDLKNVSFDTQLKNLDNIETNFVLSILITDEKFEPKNKIKESIRGAVYDGIITFSNDITFIIENKPKSYNVWEEQLDPNLSSIKNKDDIILIGIPAIVEWKDIIRDINSILNLESVSGSEKSILNDFIDFVNSNFSFLNPYDRLSLCNNNISLVQKRIQNILLEIAADKNDVKYHPGWAYYIETGFSDVRMAAIQVPEETNGDYYLLISLYFGDTISQARKFYRRQIPFEEISNLGQGWECVSDFHLSHIQTHIILFNKETGKVQEYYNYWLNNIDKIKQYPKHELVEYLKELHKKDIIKLTDSISNELQLKLINTERKTANLAPAIGLHYKIDRKTAEKLDNSNLLTMECKKRFKEGLSILKEKITFLKDAR